MKAILTRKQTMVLALIMKGKTNSQIADALDISDKGVKFHKTNIFKMYRVKNTQALIVKHSLLLERMRG